MKKNDFDGVYFWDIFSNIDKSDNLQEREKEKFILQLKQKVRKELCRQMPFRSQGYINNLINAGIKLFGQLYYYLYNDQIYTEINDRFYKKLCSSRGPVHLIGFSLGSLISFCALQQRMDVAKKVKNFIMVGSPMVWLMDGMEARADIKAKPTVNYFTNVAGKLDIAWPQRVPYIVKSLDENVKVVVNRINPIEGHMSYFNVRESINKIATLVKKYYDK